MRKISPIGKNDKYFTIVLTTCCEGKHFVAQRGDNVLADASHNTSQVQVINPHGASHVVLVCEHASNYIPPQFNGLGLSEAASESHAAWDPGAFPVARSMSAQLDAVLVAGAVSRLIYDCNRPPEAPDAMPAKSEVFDIPGNTGLSDADRAERAKAYYYPFKDALSGQIAARVQPCIVTIHSFTPIYHGQKRDVEIGILHDSDSKLADAMLKVAADHTSMKVERNAPYGPEHGVMHTLNEQGIKHGHRNVMIEIRNDLIADEASQSDVAQMLAGWITQSLAALSADEGTL